MSGACSRTVMNQYAACAQTYGLHTAVVYRPQNIGATGIHNLARVSTNARHEAPPSMITVVILNTQTQVRLTGHVVAAAEAVVWGET